MNKYLVEFIGTFFFLYVILSTSDALAIGGALILAIYIGSCISGGNFNPVVSLIMASIGKIPMNDLLPYIVSQVAGGLAALELYRRMR
jgi:glycerol uptake facilitator-like aquaporin